LTALRLDLSDKTVLVTGASRGIGHSIARKMADAGAFVAAHFIRSSDRVALLAEQTGGSVVPFQADLAQTSECRRLFEEVANRFGGIDVLVNNAGVAVHVPLEAAVEEWESAWNLTLEVNLKAAELLCRLAILHFREHGGGRIINIASRAAFRGDVPEYMTYAASKAGLVALTRSIARGCGADGIRAFVVAPGFVRTDMAQDFIDEFGEAHALRDLATHRLTEPDDVAPTVVFLASGLADHATGCTIDVNAASYVH
jgi:NAD(P)-dependent dehydrogenase (short-subunit alcohol dehydrogenase family)